MPVVLNSLDPRRLFFYPEQEKVRMGNDVSIEDFLLGLIISEGPVAWLSRVEVMLI